MATNPQNTEKEEYIALLPASVRLLVDVKDPDIQRYVALAREIAAIKAKRNDRR